MGIARGVGTGRREGTGPWSFGVEYGRLETGSPSWQYRSLDALANLPAPVNRIHEGGFNAIEKCINAIRVEVKCALAPNMGNSLVEAPGGLVRSRGE